jgi:hypothetical protein
MGTHIYSSEMLTSYCCPSLNRDLAGRYVQPILARRRAIAAAYRDDFLLVRKHAINQSCLVTATPELPAPKKEDHAEIPTTNGMTILLTPKDPMSMSSSEGGEVGDKANPSGSLDGNNFWNLTPAPSLVHAQTGPVPGTAIADDISTPALSPNTLIEARSRHGERRCAPSLSFHFGYSIRR